MQHSIEFVRKLTPAITQYNDNMPNAYSVSKTGRHIQREEARSEEFALFCAMVGYNKPVVFDLLDASCRLSGYVVRFQDARLAANLSDKFPASLVLSGKHRTWLVYLIYQHEDAWAVLDELRRGNSEEVYIDVCFPMPGLKCSEVALSAETLDKIDGPPGSLPAYELDQFDNTVASEIRRMRRSLPTTTPADYCLGFPSIAAEPDHEPISTTGDHTPRKGGERPAAAPQPITEKELKELRLMADGPKAAKARGVILAKALGLAEAMTETTSEEEIVNLFNKCLELKDSEGDGVRKRVATKTKRTPGAITKLWRDVQDDSKGKSDEKSGIDKDGWVTFSDDSEFYIASFEGSEWVYKRSKKNGDQRLCQRFRVSRTATNIGGKGQHLTIAFPSITANEISVTVPRGELHKYATVGQALLDAGFTCTDVASVSGILMPLAFAANALLIERTGFAYDGNAFLRPDGRTVRHKGRNIPETERPYLQSPGADRPPHLFSAGTKEGYIAAIRPAFVDAKGNTRKPVTGAFDPGPFPNVAFMTLGAAAGVIHTFANPLDGVLLASIVAPSGSIKTIGAELNIAGSGNPTSDESGFFTWDATKAGLEVRLPRLSGCNLGLDELRAARSPEQVEMMLWMLFAGKGGVRSNNQLGEPKTRVFGGVCVITSEELLADYFKRHNITPPPGFDARVVSIKYTREMIPRQEDPEAIKIITGFRAGARANYGHAADAVVNELLRMTAEGKISPDALRDTLFAYRNELAALVKDRQTMDDRAADLFATFRYSGELLQHLGFFPSDYDVKALVEWTWMNCRVGVRTKSPGDALVNHLRSVILANGDRITEWSKDWYLNGGDDYRGALAWRSKKTPKGKDTINIIMITEDKLAEIAKELTGGASDLIEELEKIGALIPGPDAKPHRSRSKVSLNHYQIDADRLFLAQDAGEGDDEA
ncbi:DUF927 domain-containing protein [Mesorhizobium sp. M1169]|uniref:DUF927 domain-containing protein n=1 Tax=unclassified Mesorhizobium TaxID=325217 RepID=UPI0033370C1A